MRDQVLQGQRELYGDAAPETLGSMASLGMLLKDLGDLEGARVLFREAVDGALATLGEEHPRTKSHQRWLARVEKLGEELAAG